MKPRFLISFVLTLIFVTASTTSAVERVARRYNLMEFAIVSASPVGTYDRVGTVDLTNEFGNVAAYDADRVFNSTWGVSLFYGQLRNDIFVGGLGLKYIKVKHNLLFEETTVNFHQFDMEITLNVHPFGPAQAIFSPYGGATVDAGMTITDPQGYRTETSLGLGLSGNFGFDFKLWSEKANHSFLTLTSFNTYNLMASSGRPRYLQIGAGLRYWFRP